MANIVKNNVTKIKLRNSIDKIDEKILELINERLLLAKKIGEIKKGNNEQVFDSGRENSIIKRLSALNNGLLSQKSLKYIVNEIFAASREIQKKSIVVYLGPKATFTHIAAIKHFGRCVSFFAQDCLHDVFYEVEKGNYDYGVVPIENSIEGAVNHTLDLFFESNLRICAEIYTSISHDLLSKNGDLKDIKTVYSHPQAFAQCRTWLKRYMPNVALVECASTAHAAKKTSQEPQSAAVASKEAAHLYNLKVIASGIEDSSKNATRFLVISKNIVHKTGHDKTSLMFAIAHAPGALHKALEPISKSRINMVKLESRPTKHENWNYFFFADIEGHMEDSNIQKVIAEMKNLCMYLKCLGSYPMR